MKRQFGFLLAALVGLAAFGDAGVASYVYVATDGNDSTGDGSFGNPYKTPATGIAQAYATAGKDTVYLKTGTYTVSTELLLDQALTLKGEDRDTTTIKQTKTSGTARVLVVSNSNARVESLTISNGRVEGSDPGGNIRMFSGVVSNCVIHSGTGYGYWGPSGVNVHMSGGTLTHSIVRDNKTGGIYNNTGAGVAVGGNDVTIDTCLIKGNSCFGGWGGKAAAKGGGIYVGNYTGVTVQNCTIANNKAKYGGGLYTVNSSTVVRNCIFAGNTASDQSSTGAGYPNLGADKTTTWAANVGPCVVDAGLGIGDHVRVGDPLFVDADNGDYHLSSADSPAVGYGVSYAGQAGDFEGKARKALPDCGCYESDYVIVLVTLSVTFDRAICNKGDTVAFTATATGVPKGETLVATWTLTDSYGTQHQLSGTALSISEPMTVAGFFTLSCSVTGTVNPGVKGAFVGTDILRVVPPVVYVDATSTNPRIPYDTPETAAKTVSHVTSVVSTNCTLQIAEGTYSFDKNFRDRNTWQYGFQLDYPFTIRGAGRDKTKLLYDHTDAQTSGQPNFGIVLLNHPEALVEDITLARGIASYGGCVKIGANGGTVRRCRITDGHARSTGALGSGLYMNSSAALVENCLIENNEHRPLYDWGSVVGSVYIESGTLRNCIVRTNLVNRSTHESSYRIVHAGAGAVVENCTIVGNVDKSLQPAALYVCAGAQVINTIVISNEATEATASTSLYGAPDWRVASEAAKGGVSNCFFNADIPLGTACRSGDVGFADYAGTNYALTIQSRCRNRGQLLPWMAGSKDFYGTNRVFGTRVDIGAAECQRMPGLGIVVR